MVKEMGKVLFFDIDGTLLDFTGVIPDSAIYALEQARKNGHHIAICSGRARFQIMDRILACADGLIGSTGAYAEVKGEILYEHYMPAEVIREVCDVLKDASAHAIGMSRTTTMMNQDCREYMENNFLNRFNPRKKFERIFGNPIMTDHLENFADIQKILYHNSDRGVDEIADRLKKICDVTASSIERKTSDSGEITLRGINKSYGMRRYMEMLNLSSCETVAFGDGPNDFDMIESADIGVVMGNGRDELKEKADFVTKRIDEDGIYYAMKELHLID